ncbi:MAG: hypothetical protein ACYC6P_09645 [Ignavibacteriaceae bacterium]
MKITIVKMNSLESILEKSDNWEYKLYLLIKNELYNLDKPHHIGHKEINENLKRIFVESVEFISDNKQKYLIINQDKLSIPNERLIKQFLRGNIEVDESSYELNTRSINKLLKTNFIFPLVNEMELKSRNKHLEREKDLLNNELDKENAVDRRKPKLKCDDYIKEVLRKGDIKLKREDLAKQIKKRIQEKHPSKRFSVTTIRPRLSYIKLK